MLKTLVGTLIVVLLWKATIEVQAQVPLRTERELIGLLESSAPAADKAIACKELAVVGTDASLSALSKLLGNPELSSWARIAVEANPSAAASEALRNATESLEGRLLIGVINSIGVRRDEAAVNLLSSFLRSGQLDLVDAASIALGRIGNSTASKTLLAELSTPDDKLREAIAQGCNRCADRMFASGQEVDALELVDSVRISKVSMQRRCEATRMVILIRKSEGLPLLTETLTANDKRMFAIGLAVIRELACPRVAANVADVIEVAEPDRAAEMIKALADRNDPEVLPVLAKTAESGSTPVRLAAIESLGLSGDATVLDSLLRIALDHQAELAQAARLSLSRLPGDEVNDKLAKMLPAAQGDQRLLLLELVARRRIPATAELVKAVGSTDQRIYLAAVKALGETIELPELSLLLQEVLKPRFDSPEVMELCRKALRVAATRMADRDACVSVLDESLGGASPAVKQFLLEVVAEVGGTKSLQVVSNSARSSDSKLQDTGSRLLGKWSSLDAANVILDYAQTGPTPQYRSRALKGYISLARRFSMPEPDRVGMCRKAIAASSQSAERTLVLDVLKLHPSPEAFVMAMELSERDDLKADATTAGIAIAQNLGGDGIDLALLKKALGKRSAKVEILNAEYGAGSNWTNVTEQLRQHVNGTTWISLNSSNYNQTFGADPAPGIVKQLKVQFRIDGKPGEAIFAENQLLVLPDPK